MQSLLFAGIAPPRRSYFHCDRHDWLIKPVTAVQCLFQISPTPTYGAGDRLGSCSRINERLTLGEMMALNGSGYVRAS